MCDFGTFSNILPTWSLPEPISPHQVSAVLSLMDAISAGLCQHDTISTWSSIWPSVSAKTMYNRHYVRQIPSLAENRWGGNQDWQVPGPSETVSTDIARCRSVYDGDGLCCSLSARPSFCDYVSDWLSLQRSCSTGWVRHSPCESETESGRGRDRQTLSAESGSGRDRVG